MYHLYPLQFNKLLYLMTHEDSITVVKATNKARTHCNQNKEKAMEVSRPHATQTDIQHYQTGP